MNRIPGIFFFLFLPLLGFAAANSDSTELSLSQCLLRAVQNNLSLIPSHLEIQAHDGLIEQAGLLPNPELEFEAENVLGTGEFQTFQGTEATLAVSQLIETGGKRFFRLRLAELDKQQAQGELEAAQWDTLYRTASAFITLLAAQERAALDQEFYRMAQQVRDTITAGVDAGKESPIEKIRAQVTAESTEMVWKRAQQEQSIALRDLAALMGEETPSFERVSGDLYALPTIEDVSAWMETISAHPDMELAQTEIEQKRAAWEMEKANAVPDVVIGGGVRYLSETDDAAFVLGLSVPLPFSNRNQGAIRAAQDRVKKAEAQKSAKSFNLRTAIRTHHQSLMQSREQLERLQSSLLPQARQAFESVQEGYRQGKFPYLNVLDAQRSLFEIQLEIVNTAEEYHEIRNELDRLSAGYSFDEVPK